MSIVLRPYQQEALECIHTSLQTSDTALCVIPTGGGKTVIFAEFIRQSQQKTLVLAHRKELLDQARNKIVAVYPEADIGMIGYGRSSYGQHVTVASVASLRTAHRLEQLVREDIGLVIIDECHHAMALSYLSVIEKLQNVKILGFTATPERLDKKDISELFGDPVYEKNTVDLIADGYLTDIRSFIVRSGTTSLDGVGTQGGDYRTSFLAKAIDRPDRNGIVVESYKQYADGLSAIVFAASVEHGQHLAEAFSEDGIPALSISGETDADEREKILWKYESGEIKVLVNVMLLTEGVDLPRTSCIIMARPTKSRGLFKQCLGRGLRLYTDPITGESKSCCVFIDITDNYKLQTLAPVRITDALEGVEIRNGLTIAEVKAAIEAERQKREEEAKERERKRLEEEEREQDREQLRRKKYAEQQRVLTYMDSVLTKQIDLLGTHLKWELIGEKSYRLIVGQDTLYMQHVDRNLYQVYISFFNKVGRFALLEEPINLVHAQNLCAKYTQTILEGKSNLLYPHASWKSQPATEKHLQALSKCRIPIPENCTKGKASELLDLYWAHPSRANRSDKVKAS